jgi:type VI secretion system protein ImpI
MDLVLSIVRCPDAAVPETRSFGGGEVVIGRGEDCGWKLADPDHHLSRRHCSVAYRAGAWHVTDLSTNGTHVNRSPSPIGKGNEVTLRDGDRLTLGEYEIEVRLQDTASAASLGGIGGPVQGDDPFAPFTSEPPAGPGPVNVGGPLIPDDFSLEVPGPGDVEPWHGGSRPDHAPTTSDFYAPPKVSVPVIPDDFDLDLPGGKAPPGPPAAPPAGKLPDSWDLDEPLTPPPATSPPAVTPPAAPPLAQAAPPPGAWDFDAPPPPAQPVPPAHAAPPARAASPAQTAPGDAALLQAFLDGMGLAGLESGGPDPATLMKGLGAAFRAFVEGLREVLITRATIKSEFRIEQTIIAARGNNPLKFSPTPEDALVAMLGRSRAFMAPDAAVKDALDDIKRHELATMEAMQAAVRALLGRLDPAAIRGEAEQGGGLSLLPAQKRARAFELYEQRFAAALADLDDSSDGAFARAFAKAYEAASGKR